jgi:hypothetical protein
MRLTKPRRLKPPSHFGRRDEWRGDSRVRTAAADISRHHAIEILVAGIGIRFPDHVVF